jgi:hypothetical protein
VQPERNRAVDKWWAWIDQGVGFVSYLAVVFLFQLAAVGVYFGMGFGGACSCRTHFHLQWGHQLTCQIPTRIGPLDPPHLASMD